jgi:hypothetical protein
MLLPTKNHSRPEPKMNEIVREIETASVPQKYRISEKAKGNSACILLKAN